MPTAEILATLVSATSCEKLISPLFFALLSAFSALNTWSVGHENVMSVRPSSAIFWIIISTLTPASESGPNIAAAIPGRSATDIKVIFASSLECAIPDTIFDSIISSSLHTSVPALHSG